MGRRGRRTVLQLGDSSDGFLAKYGYNRQEEEIPGGNEESDEEPEEDARKTPPMEVHVNKPKENGDLIDNQVASFLAQLEHEDSNEVPERPGFGTDPDPNFKSEQKTSHPKEPEPVYNKSRSMYKNMFVKGDVEFTGKSDKEKTSVIKEAEVEWPEEPVTVWQQTLDDNTQCYYYWNTVTNEVTWDIPPGFTQYLLQMKSYEERVAKLQKEGKVKPEKKKDEKDKISVGPADQPSPAAPARKKETTKPEKEVKDDNPKSTENKTSSSKNSLVAAAYFDSDADSSGSDSESGDDRKKKGQKKTKESDEDLDIDDIDKALEVALEKKKSKSSKDTSDKKDSKSKSESKPSVPKKLTLIDSIKEQVQRKMEVEARRKAAIEEMMARELERRVGPPRKRSGDDETVWDSKRPKIVDYGHSRSRSPVIESGSRSEDRDSRRRHEGHRDKDNDRHSHKEKKKKKDKDKDRDDHRHRDEKRRDHDKHEKEHKDRKKDKKKDKDDKRRDKDDRKEKDDRKDRDEKKDRDRDKERDREKERKKDKHEEKEKKTEEKDHEKLEQKKTEEKKEKIEIKTEDVKIEIEKEEGEVDDKEEEEEEVETIHVDLKQEVEEKMTKKTLNVDIDAELENIVTGVVKVDVDLANKKMQASELADLALSKLEFLEVTKKGLSKLQILLVELETRHQDWQAGGLNTEFYLIKLEEANWQLEQYERSAAPPGWSCHWDRSYRRYFYMNKRTKQTQWDYPDEDDEEEDESHDSSPEQESVPVVIKEPENKPTVTSNSAETEIVTSTTLEQGEVTTTEDIVSSTKDTREEQRPPLNTDSWPDYDAVTNYISGTEYSGVIRGEPPPPGTDLEFLLTAPPPPPPPIEEENYPSYDVPGPPEGHQRTELEETDDIDGVVMEEGNDFCDESEIVQTENDNMNEQYDETGTDADTDMVDPMVIARPPQIFTENPYSSYYDPNTVVSEQYQETGQYYMDSGVDMTTSVETPATGEAASSQQDREKKKKKKEKQPSGHLKNKNVSNLVQKWQKVKKEVEIEEQEREERQNAIRQKLDEWKKEHS